MTAQAWSLDMEALGKHTKAVLLFCDGQFIASKVLPDMLLREGPEDVIEQLQSGKKQMLFLNFPGAYDDSR